MSDERSTLIKAVHDRCTRFDESARNDAVEFARNPDDDTLRERAIRTVLMADVLGDAGNDIIALINAGWPKEKK